MTLDVLAGDSKVGSVDGAKVGAVDGAEVVDGAKVGHAINKFVTFKVVGIRTSSIP